MTQCKFCGGKGRIVNWTTDRGKGHGKEWSSKGAYVTMKCQVCEGSGKEKTKA